MAELTQTLSEANGAFQSGNLADAVAKAKIAKDKAIDIMTTLGMQVPAEAKS